jgi:DNA-binding transcriptional regulator YiaG
LAMEAFRRREGVSIAAIAKIYNVSQKTLARRARGAPARRDTTPKIEIDCNRIEGHC